MTAICKLPIKYMKVIDNHTSNIGTLTTIDQDLPGMVNGGNW